MTIWLATAMISLFLSGIGFGAWVCMWIEDNEVKLGFIHRI